MPKPDGTMTFDEWLEEQAHMIEFEEGDTAEKHLEEGKKYLEEEVRKEEESRLRRLSRQLKRRGKRISR